MAAIIDADRTDTVHAPLNNESLSAGRDPIWLCERLSIIQREAKRARARAIYRAAQDALGLIQRCNVHMPIDWVRVDGRLFVLNKLIGQYEAGLTDVETELGLTHDTTAETATPALAVLSRPLTETLGSEETLGLGETLSDETARADATHTLSRLLPHASVPERAALSRLMNIDLTPAPPRSRDTQSEDQSEGATPTHSMKDNGSVLNAAPKAISVDRIEWIMPGLVQKLLEYGRQYEKIFSVSHSLDDVLIDAGSADRVQTRLFERLSDLIASNLPMQGVGRLDICASGNELLISGSGFDSFAFPLTERVPDRVHDTLDTIARDLEAEADAKLVTPPRPPMITADTESQLRAQLAALMDGGLANFNGSDQ